MELYLKDKNAHTRWASFENPKGEKGQGGKENGGAKGRPSESVKAGETKTLMSVEGSSGVVNKMWITVDNRSPEMLQLLKLEMFWDNADTPAVSVPLGGFFCAPVGNPAAFESYLFSNPEGRSFNCFIQMPFLSGAKITLTNESDTTLGSLFYDVNYTLKPIDKDAIMYFHSVWNRENPVELCKDYTILSKSGGEGRFLGFCMGVNTNPLYETSWFGEGELKVYLDGDGEFPTLCGTGTEDYIGTAWGQGKFANMSQGCLVANDNKYSYYRFHIADPIYFHSDVKVTMQNMGGAMKEQLLRIVASGAPVKVVTGGGAQLYLEDFKLTESSPDGWYNYYRSDDFSSIAYYYFDKPF